jgi:hypothetical protein
MTLISLYTVKLIIISLIAILYLATANTTSSNKTEIDNVEESVVNEVQTANERPKGFSIAEVEFVTAPTPEIYNRATELKER